MPSGIKNKINGDEVNEEKNSSDFIDPNEWTDAFAQRMQSKNLRRHGFLLWN